MIGRGNLSGSDGAAMVNICVTIIITTPMLLGESMLLAAAGIGLLASATIYAEMFIKLGERWSLG